MFRIFVSPMDEPDTPRAIRVPPGFVCLVGCLFGWLFVWLFIIIIFQTKKVQISRYTFCAEYLVLGN